MSKKLMATMLISSALALSPTLTTAQQVATSQPSAEEQAKAKAELEKKAYTLLEQVISDAQSLRLPENRVRVQITSGDLLWKHDDGRARALFGEAAGTIAEMMRAVESTDRQYFNQIRVPSQLRQELLLTVARYDATLAYQFLQTTKPPAPPANAGNSRFPNLETNVEQQLLAQIAAIDPKLALQNAEAMLDKGEYSNTLAKVLGQAQRTDGEAAAKFSAKLLKKLQSENLLAKREASNLALTLLLPGPLPVETSSNQPKPTSTQQSQILSNAPYRELLETIIAAALKAQPTNTGTQGRGGNNQRGDSPRSGQGGQGGGPGGGRGASGGGQIAGTQPPTPPTEAQIEQMNTRAMLMGLQSLLPQIDQNLPARSQAVRQKLSEFGIRDDPRAAFAQYNTVLRQGTTDELLVAAATAPPAIQPRLYQQAVTKAIDDGQPERAQQIANDHLDQTTRASIQQKIALQEAARAAGDEKAEEVRQTISSLRNDEERVRTLLQLAGSTQKANPKRALELLDEARNLVIRRASNYQQFDAQLRVARAYATIDPARSFETLEPGIRQLNEMLPAAALLSGFETNTFKDGEMPLQGGGMLGSMVQRYAQELAFLAKSDFDRSQSEAERFQMVEARIMTRLAIVRGALGTPQVTSNTDTFAGRGFGGPNAPFGRRPE
jgi:hypothetical protein